MSTGSSRSGTDWTKTVPPPSHVRKLIQWPAPCMNGGASSARSPVSASATNCSIEVAVFDPPKHSTMRRRCATSRPWACRWCRRCRGCRGRRATSRRRACSGDDCGQRVLVPRRRRAAVRCRTRRAPGGSRRGSAAPAAPRPASGRTGEWTTTALAFESASRYCELLGHVAVVDVQRADPRLERRRASPRGTRCRCGGRSRGGPGRSRGPAARTRSTWQPSPRPSR